MASTIRTRMAWMLVAGLLVAVVPATAASARPEPGGVAARSETCLLPQEILKNEPGLCAGFRLAQEGIVDGGEPASPPSSSMGGLDGGEVVALTASLILVAGFGAVVIGRSMRSRSAT